MQSKKNSFIEALVNTGIGFGITLAASFIVYPLCGVIISTGKMGMVTVCFTVISIIRQYIIRRFFNKKTEEPLSEKTVLPYKRRTGRTTRRVDKIIQKLFIEGESVVYDHWYEGW